MFISTGWNFISVLIYIRNCRISICKDKMMILSNAQYMIRIFWDRTTTIHFIWTIFTIICAITTNIVWYTLSTWPACKLPIIARNSGREYSAGVGDTIWTENNIINSNITFVWFPNNTWQNDKKSTQTINRYIMMTSYLIYNFTLNYIILKGILWFWG